MLPAQKKKAPSKHPALPPSKRLRFKQPRLSIFRILRPVRISVLPPSKVTRSGNRQKFIKAECYRCKWTPKTINRLFDASSGCGRDELALVRISLTNAVKAHGVFSATAPTSGISSPPHYWTCDTTCDPLEEPPMSLFQAIVDSIANPQHAGSNSDLQGLLNLAQLIPGVQDTEQHVKPILDVLGPHLQEVLNNQQQTQGQTAAQQTVSNLSQPGVGVQELQNLFGADRFNSIIGEIASRTGLDQQVILGALPIVIPIIMKLLAGGTNQSNPQAENPVLSNFLGGQNGGALLTEALSLASQFIKR
jgi:hypothetical protein